MVEQELIACFYINWERGNVPVRESNNKTVAWAVVLALVLGHKTTTGLVISLSLTTTTPFGLIALAIGLILCKLDASHS